MKFSIKDFFSKYDQIHTFLQIWSHLPKKSLMENFIFCAVLVIRCYGNIVMLKNYNYLDPRKDISVVLPTGVRSLYLNCTWKLWLKEIQDNESNHSLVSQQTYTSKKLFSFHCGCSNSMNILILNPSRPNPGRREKINLNLYFQPSLQSLKRFYEDLIGLNKTFWGTTKKCENENFKWLQLDSNPQPLSS